MSNPLDKPAQPPARELVRVSDESEFANLLDTSKFEHLYRVATMFSKSQLVPEHFRGKEADCMIACQMAVRLKVDPFMFMQNTYVVHGKPGMQASLAIALINSAGIFENSLDYEIDDPAGKGPMDPNYRVRAFAVRRDTKKRVDGPWVDWKVVKAEGWYDKSGSKWKTMPGMMFTYRAASWFGRLHCPERLMGMQTADELDDVEVRKFVQSEPVQTTQYLEGMAGESVPTPPEGERKMGNIEKPRTKKAVAKPVESEPEPAPPAEELVVDAEPEPEPEPLKIADAPPEEDPGRIVTQNDRSRLRLVIDAAFARAGHAGKITDAMRASAIGQLMGVKPEEVGPSLKTATITMLNEVIARAGRADFSTLITKG